MSKVKNLSKTPLVEKLEQENEALTKALNESEMARMQLTVQNQTFQGIIQMALARVQVTTKSEQ